MLLSVILAVVAARTLSLTSRPVLTASTYALVAASCACVGSATLVIRLLLTSTVPVPVGAIVTLLLPAAPASVSAPLVAVILVAVAAPSTGVTNVGLVANTRLPLPVSSLITPANSLLVVAANTLSLFAI